MKRYAPKTRKKKLFSSKAKLNFFNNAGVVLLVRQPRYNVGWQQIIINYIYRSWNSTFFSSGCKRKVSPKHCLPLFKLKYLLVPSVCNLHVIQKQKIQKRDVVFEKDIIMTILLGALTMNACINVLYKKKITSHYLGYTNIFLCFCCVLRSLFSGPQ